MWSALLLLTAMQSPPTPVSTAPEAAAIDGRINIARDHLRQGNPPQNWVEQDAIAIIRLLGEQGEQASPIATMRFSQALRLALRTERSRNARSTITDAIDAAEAASLARGANENALWLATLAADIQPDASAAVAALAHAHGMARAHGLLASRQAGLIRSKAAEWARDLNQSGASADADAVMSALITDLDSAPNIGVDGPGLGTRYDLLLRRAEALAKLGNAPASDADWVAAAAILDHAGATAEPLRASYNNQRAYYLNMQRRFAEAEPFAREAVRRRETTSGPDDINTHKARFNYGVAIMEQGRAAEALPLFEGALTAQMADPFASDRDTIILRTTLARAYLLIGEPDTAQAQIDGALALARQARERRLTGGGRERQDLVLAALSRAVAGSERNDPLSPAFDVAMLTAWALHTRDATAIDRAFRAAQDLTLSDAGDAINQAAARQLAGGGTLGLLIRQRQQAAQTAIAADRALRQAVQQRNASNIVALRTTRDETAARLAQFDADVMAQFPGYAALVSPASVGIADIQRSLENDQAVLMLMASEGHQYIFAIGKTAARWQRIDGGAAAVAAAVARLRCRIDEATCSIADYDAAIAAEQAGTPSAIDTVYPRYDRGTAWQLYRDIIQPVEDVLPRGGRIFVINSGAIASLPLAVLVTQDPGSAAEAGDAASLLATPWLGDRYAFVTLASASALLQGDRVMRRNAPGPMAMRQTNGAGAPGRQAEPRNLPGANGRGANGRGGGPRGGGGAGGRVGGGPGGAGGAMSFDLPMPEGRRPAALVGYGAPTLSGQSSDAANARGGRSRGGVRAILPAALPAIGRSPDDDDANTSADGDVPTLANPDWLRQLAALPGTATELAGLADGAVGAARIHTGNDATETRVKGDSALATARTIVFATHGLLPGEMGAGSEPGLVLTPPAVASAEDDGLLTAAEVANLDLHARYVFLSACNSASGTGSESLSALARSFLYAGADALVASHWRVSDEATAALTINMQAAATLTPARALQAAMRAVRTGRGAGGTPIPQYQPSWAHPAAWAPFTLITNRDM